MKFNSCSNRPICNDNCICVQQNAGINLDGGVVCSLLVCVVHNEMNAALVSRTATDFTSLVKPNRDIILHRSLLYNLMEYHYCWIRGSNSGMCTRFFVFTVTSRLLLGAHLCPGVLFP
jgi:hypothetical protein